MKNNLLAILFIFLFVVPGFSQNIFQKETINLGQITVKQGIGRGNRFRDIKVSVGMSEDQETVTLQVQLSGMNSIIILFIRHSELQEAVNKYFEWEKTAVENQVEIQKEIRTDAVDAGFLFGDEWHFGFDAKINYIFFSQNPNTHQLLIGTSKIQSALNQFIDTKLDYIYLGKPVVTELVSVLNRYEEAIEALKEKEAVEELFQ